MFYNHVMRVEGKEGVLVWAQSILLSRFEATYVWLIRIYGILI